jgi:glycosyltransferase A (GT-A) superfamily protein (DUF2064 family)
MIEGAVLVFAKRPELGQVKTRLQNQIGKQLTLALYRAFLTDTLDSARRSGATVILAHTPGPAFPEQDLADLTIEQHGLTFGERFDSAFEEAANQLPSKTSLILIGADTPHISPHSLREAISLLGDRAAVIGPNITNGFYLLGFSGHPVPVSQVFSHPGIEETAILERVLKEAQLKVRHLSPQFDIDLPQDLRRLARLIDAREALAKAWIPKNTRDLLLDRVIVRLRA